ncbi:MAG: bis(5'-nucleosyl)-tetraphosphatase (symmetrical) YqeK [Bacillota bacterium]|nr:bis(5'-nucleosyl)-tetraphosphatase (symmetrical) YqeK [Bacillota bacterium]
MRRIGLLCGTFDPVHLGHIKVAQACLTALYLDKVLFVPLERSFTRLADASPRHRAEMIRIAISGIKGLEVSDAFAETGARHEVDILASFKKSYPDAEFVYMIGANKAASVPTWKNAEALFRQCSFAIFPRMGYNARELSHFLISHGARASVIPVEQLSMSSVQIRAQIRLLSDAPGKLAGDVAEYIASNGLYQPDYDRMVSQAVSPARFVHSKGVRQTAVRLARRYSLPMQKAGVAGILHDCAKNMELSRLQTIAKRAKLPLDPLTLSSNALLHGPVGAQVAKTRYHILDVHILDAIRYHTTGRAGMRALELAVFVADAIEPSRKYPGLQVVREQAEEDLRLSALTSLVGTQEFVKTKGLRNSPLSFQAVEDLSRRLKTLTIEEDFGHIKN